MQTVILTYTSFTIIIVFILQYLAICYTCVNIYIYYIVHTPLLKTQNLSFSIQKIFHLVCVFNFMMQILFHNKFNHFFIYPFSNGTEFLYYDIIILLHQFKSGDIIFWVISCSLVSSLNKSVLVYSSHSYYNFHFQFHFLSYFLLIFTGFAT